jgi:hypothetical protein
VIAAILLLLAANPLAASECVGFSTAMLLDWREAVFIGRVTSLSRIVHLRH